MLPVNPFYRLFWEDGYRFDYSADARSLEEQIRQKSPRDVEGYQQFLAYSEKVFHEGYEKLVACPVSQSLEHVFRCATVDSTAGLSFGL